MSTLDEFTGDGHNPRPPECECHKTFHSLACWSCYRAGFDDPNPLAKPGDSE